MKEAIIHIGTEKTGTSTIQNFLSNNRDQLFKHYNILYPKSIGKINHQRLCLIAAPTSIRTRRMKMKFGLLDPQIFGSFKTQFIEDFKNEIEKNTSKKILISSEHLSSRLQNQIEIGRLKYFFDKLGLVCKIVVYFRRQDRLIPSEFSTSLKVGNVVKLDPNKHNFWFNYYSLAKNWADVFGHENIICRAFDKSKLVNRSLIDDFLNILEIQRNNLKSPSKNANTSLDANLLCFLEEFNKRVPFSKDQKLNKNRGNIAALLTKLNKKISDPRQLQFSLEESKMIFEKYRIENEMLAKHFGVDLNFRLDHIVKTQDIGLTKEEIYDIFGYLWQEKQHEINLLKSQQK